MQSNEIRKGFFESIWSTTRQVVFFVILFGFSIYSPGQSASSNPARTELHEKAASRVSKLTYVYQHPRRNFESYVRPDYEPFLTLTEIRICHHLWISHQRNFHFNSHNGIHLRLPQTHDEPSVTLSA